MKFGSMTTGPSSPYLKLLKGEITAEDYAKKVMERIQEEPGKQFAEADSPGLPAMQLHT
jgi:hypothetical protein